MARVDAVSPLLGGPSFMPLRLLLSDDESAEFKDVEAEAVQKFYDVISYSDSILVDYVDFSRDPTTGEVAIIPHFSVTVPISRLAVDIQGELRFTLGSIDMSADDVAMISDSVKVGLVEMRREFYLRLRFVDSQISNPIRFTPMDYSRTVRSFLDRALTRRVQRPATLNVTSVLDLSSQNENFKEIWFFIESSGSSESPFTIQDYVRSLQNNLVAEISVNEFIIDSVNVFPAGWIEMEKYIAEKEAEMVPEIPEKRVYTGTVTLTDLPRLTINNLYLQKDPDSTEFNKAIVALFNPLLALDIENLGVDFYEPTADDMALTHFSFEQKSSSEKTLSDMVDLIDSRIEPVSVEYELTSTLSRPELSTTRRFKVTVTSDLTQELILEKLQNGTSGEFDLLSDFQSVGGKVFFDIETERNVPVIRRKLEKLVNEKLGSIDALVKIPGEEFLPSRQWTAALYLNVSETEADLVHDNWKEISPAVSALMSRLTDWEYDYAVAFSETIIEIFVFAEFPFDTPRANLEEILDAEENIVRYTFEAPREFAGKCDFNGPDKSSELVNQTVFSLATGMSQNFPPVTTISVNYIESDGNVLFNSQERRRRQAEDPLPVIFKFEGGKNERLSPQQLENQGRNAIRQNPSLSGVLDADSFKVEPDMFDPVKEPEPTLPPEPESTTEQTTESKAD